MEALSALLSSIHEDNPSLCSNNCPAHPVFQIKVQEKLVCKCKASKEENWDLNTFSHQFYVNALLEETEQKDAYALIRKKQNQAKIEILDQFELSNVIGFENRLISYIRGQWEESV